MRIAARPVFLGNVDLLIRAVAKCLVGHYNGVKVVGRYGAKNKNSYQYFRSRFGGIY